jgi:nickel-dependent lactate racemase
VLVIVNDATRPTPTAVLLEAVWEEICSWDLTFLVATGTHRAPSGEELRHIFGKFWGRVKERVWIHDARDDAGLLYVGKTSAGTEVFLNRMAVEAGKILVLGSIETHYFAGYTGGRKIVLPGISGFRTIEQNHRLAMDLRAQALVLRDNPVHLDMDEALDFLAGDPHRDVFAILAVLDREHRLYSVDAGDIRQAFLQAASRVDELFSVPAFSKADIVIAVATPPLDIDFYQTQKAVENGKRLLNDGGILLVISACRTGVGNEAFLNLMREAPSPEAVLEKAQRDYHLGYHKAARLAQVATCSEMWSVVGVADEVPRAAFMRPFAEVTSAVKAALEARPQGKVWVLMDAGDTVPRLIDARSAD